jgi:hypothetical protein
LKVYTFFYFFCFFLVSPLADARDFLVKKDLRLDWIFLSDEQHQMLPFLDNSSENPHAIHLLITPDYGKESFLRLEIPSATSLFIDNKFIKQNDGGTTSLLSLDSLYTRYNHDSLYLTLYNKVGFDVPPAAAIGYKYSFFDTEMNVNPILSRNMDSNEDYLKIIILVVFAFFVVLHTLLPAELTDFYSIGTLLTFRYTDTLLTKFRSLTKTHTIVIIYQAALLASIMIVSLYYYNNPLGERYPIKINPIIGWLAIFIITTVLIFFKYILIAMIFYSVIFVLISYTIINHFHSLHSLLSTLIVAVIIFNFLRLIVIYFKLRRMIPIKNLHLFSYLCSTELIPIVIGLNFFIK